MRKPQFIPFPSLIGSIKSMPLANGNRSVLYVSIPYRKYKKRQKRTLQKVVTSNVSIPYRKYKKAPGWGVFAGGGMFPSLIGSIKSQKVKSVDESQISFPSLIGSIKRGKFPQEAARRRKFPSLIGSIKRKLKPPPDTGRWPVSIPYRKYKKEYEIFVAVGKYVEFPSLIGSVKRRSRILETISRKQVSIPHRKRKKYYRHIQIRNLEKVSIPHRKYKKPGVTDAKDSFIPGFHPL